MKKKRYYFQDGEATCYAIPAHLDYMAENYLEEMDVFLARRQTGTSYFFCKKFDEVGEKSEGTCGRVCPGYQPRNGKSGVCQHYGYVYDQTDVRLTLRATQPNDNSSGLPPGRTSRRDAARQDASPTS